MEKTWNVVLGNFLGGFKVNKKSSLALVKPATFRVSDEEELEFSARYDPPGSGWYALLATIITGVVVWVIAQAVGFMAGPGILVWYLIFLYARRQDVRIALHEAEEVIIDPKNRRFAFRIPFKDKMRWLAFQTGDDFDEISQYIEARMPQQCIEGEIVRPSMVPVIILLVFLLGLFAFIGLMIAAEVLMGPKF
jgi:hypothetical protein